MMTSESCESIRGRLLDLLAGEIDGEEEDWLRSHLAECTPCARELQTLQRTLAALPDAAEATPPPEVKERILAYAREAPAVAHAERSIRSGRRWQWLAVAGIVAALFAGLAIGVALQPEVDPTAPDFVALDVITGETRTLSDYRGQVVLLNIWATWCGPCEVEMPSMERLHRRLGSEGLRVVAVSVDETGPEQVSEWVREHGLTFEVLQDRSRRIEWQFQTTGVPETIVIDRDGNIVARQIGPALWDGPAQTARFRKLLGIE
ncbi:MAG: redoxin domain-containing protein [Gemmatimonadetes bacterium]|nr:redoxin domain-containing protein [Gemmatimonadota bacterium]